MRKVIAILFVAALVAAVPASAQDKPVNVHIGGGYTFAVSEIREYLGDGYNFTLGLTFNVNPVIGFQVEYGFNGLGQKEVKLPAGVVPPTPPPGQVAAGPFFADMNMQYGDFNMVVRPPSGGAVKPYLVAGVGVYHRPVKVTTPSVGYVPGYCNPYWYVCYPGGWVPVDAIVGERSSTDFGINVGGGLNFQVSEGAAIFFEARYHYIYGPTIEGDTENRKANGQFLPITFGVRF